MSIHLIEPKNASCDVPIINDLLREFIKNGFEDSDFDNMVGNQNLPLDIVFRWKGEGALFTLRLANKADLSDAVSYSVEGTSFSVNWLLGGKKYYWQVASNNAESEIFEFTTEDTPRMVLIDGMVNTRDFGGWKTIDGRRLKQGRVYRTTRFFTATDKGKEHCINTLGIRYELDLRPTGEDDAGDGNGSAIGPAVSYVNYGFGDYFNCLEPQKKENLKNILLYFVDPNHYPMAFHCAAGRDRTGTLALILMMLCRVPLEMAMRDYDISFFSEMIRDTRLTLKEPVNRLIELLTKYGEGTIWENVEKLVLDLGLTEDDIAAIRSNLTEEDNIIQI